MRKVQRWNYILFPAIHFDYSLTENRVPVYFSLYLVTEFQWWGKLKRAAGEMLNSTLGRSDTATDPTNVVRVRDMALNHRKIKTVEALRLNTAKEV